MDPTRFDHLTRALASGTSRRRLLQGLGGGLLALVGIDRAAAAPCKKPDVKCGKG